MPSIGNLLLQIALESDSSDTKCDGVPPLLSRSYDSESDLSDYDSDGDSVSTPDTADYDSDDSTNCSDFGDEDDGYAGDTDRDDSAGNNEHDGEDGDLELQFSEIGRILTDRICNRLKYSSNTRNGR